MRKRRRNSTGCLLAVLMAVVTAAATGVQIFGGVIDSGQQEGSVSGKAEVKSVGTLRFSDPALKADPVTGQMYPDQLPDSYSAAEEVNGTAVFCVTYQDGQVLSLIHILKPVHLLWINLITDCFPALALGMEKSESDIMKRKPRDAKDGIFAGGMGFDVVFQLSLIHI